MRISDWSSDVCSSDLINVFTSSNRYFGSKVGKGLQLGFSYLPNACEDRGTSAGTTGSCQTFSGPANGSTVENMQHVSAAEANYIDALGPVAAAVDCGRYQHAKSSGGGRSG